jgi:hypothetical protein
LARNTVSVSRLADYAADPDGFIKRKGKVRNASAARAGTRHHDALAKDSPLFWWILIAALVLFFLFFSDWGLT